MIRLVVVDDHPVVRHGIVAMLHYEQDMLVVGDAADGSGLIKARPRHSTALKRRR